MGVGLKDVYFRVLNRNLEVGFEKRAMVWSNLLFGLIIEENN